MKPSATLLAAVLLACIHFTGLGASTNVPLDSLVLLDVQGLWGGQNMWVQSNGTAIVQVVTQPKSGESGSQERRYMIGFSGSQMAALGHLLEAQSFSAIHVPDRAAVPDEAHPIIWMRTGTGTSAAAMKLANDKHVPFDAVYQHLLKLVEAAKKGRLIYTGTFDWDWRPDGFPPRQEMHNLAVKESTIHKQKTNK